MEVARKLFSPSSPFPPRNHLRSYLYSSSSAFSVSMLHEQASAAFCSASATSTSSHFPTSVLLQEQRDESRPLLPIGKEDKTSQLGVERKQVESRPYLDVDVDVNDPDQLFKDFASQLLRSPALVEDSVVAILEKLIDPEPLDVVDLAKEALLASKEAASVAKDPAFRYDDLNASLSSRCPPSLSIIFIKTVKYFLVTQKSQEYSDECRINSPSDVKDKIVSSTRRLERRSKKRKVSKPQLIYGSGVPKKASSLEKKLKPGYDPNDPLRLFLRSPETRKLLTVEEESQLISQIHDYHKLVELKRTLHSQFNREPTLVEWADSAGLSCMALQSQLSCGNSSREKLIFANLRLVVYVAKQYLGKGLSLQDLLQEGSMGLMKAMQKYKPRNGCRFPSYAFWWIRHAIKKAIFQHSRTIRVPENMYALQGKIAEAKKLYIQQKRQSPSLEELASLAGITVEKLQRMLYLSRRPQSMQQPVWADQSTTIQEVTADTAIETPDVGAEKQLMRRHVRKLLSDLPLKERRVIKLRFGIGCAKQNSLSEIGAMFGLCKERIRQIETQALYKLKQSLGSHGLRAYVDLLV